MNLRSDPDIIFKGLSEEFEQKNQDTPWRETRIKGFLSAIQLCAKLSGEQVQALAGKIACFDYKPDKWNLLVRELVEGSFGQNGADVFLLLGSPEKAVRELIKALDSLLSNEVRS